MPFMRSLVRVWLLIGACAIPAAAQEISVPYTLTIDLAGVPIELPLEAKLVPGETGMPMPFELRVDVAKVLENIDVTVRAAGLENPVRDSDFRYRGTLAAIEGQRLWLKYHFNYKLNRFLDSDGSVEGRLAARTDGETIGFVAEDFYLKVSNDLVRGAVDGLGLDDEVTARLEAEANSFLQRPNAQLQIPDVLKSADVSFESVNFTNEGGPALEATGTLALTPALLLSLLTELQGKP